MGRRIQERLLPAFVEAPIRKILRCSLQIPDCNVSEVFYRDNGLVYALVNQDRAWIREARWKWEIVREGLDEFRDFRASE